ncbi:MAG: hypothetical protein HIU84_06235 [Acidobacteria bacterium]|nr:hypothetical protein [Acidobacteriota bacterium]
MNTTQSAGDQVNPEAGKKKRATWWSIPVVLGIIVIATVGLLIPLHTGSNTTVSIRLFGQHVVVAHGGVSATIALIVLLLIGISLPGWALIHASRTPKSTFTSLDRSKGRWVASMVILFLIGDASLLIVPLYYLIRVRPQLNREYGSSSKMSA